MTSGAGGSVVVTGMGAVSPAGWSVDELWAAVSNGKSCIRELKRFPTYGCEARAAGAVPGLENENPDDSLAVRFARSAVAEAVEQAGLTPGDAIDRVVVGNHGERTLPTDGSNGTLLRGPELGDIIVDIVGARSGVSLYGACAGGALAIGTGLSLIRSGDARRVIVAGVDSLLREFDYLHFSGLYAMSTRECPPEESCCPFDLRRDGFVLAEGAGVLVLESEEAAAERGAEPLVAVEGFGSAQNAYHIVASPPDAVGPTEAMEAALRDAQRSWSDVRYINAHGTSTRDNDWCESLAIRKAMGAAADDVMVSSSKSVIGHPMAAAGALEAIISAMALRANVAPPTINLHESDPRCDLDYVAHTARDVKLDVVVSNSFGFGGHSTSMLIGRAR